MYPITYTLPNHAMYMHKCYVLKNPCIGPSINHMHKIKHNHITMFEMHGIPSRMGKHGVRGRREVSNLERGIWAKTREGDK